MAGANLHDERAAQRQTDRAIFSRILVGIDGGEPSREAYRQAARLLQPGGHLELVAAVNVSEAVHTGPFAPLVAEGLEDQARDALVAAEHVTAAADASRLLRGSPEEVLLREAEREQATLVAVGTHGHSRTAEILLGGVAGTMLHDARCSVLLARRPPPGSPFPHALVAGVDGSPESLRALGVARSLAERFHVRLRVVAALRGKDVELETAADAAPELERLDRKPVIGLVEAAAGASLLVVGSRGLHGLDGLGSVSERVAHRAASSVLVVRGS
jgi:nucleotide-binding universal stress UspA family protein